MKNIGILAVDGVPGGRIVNPRTVGVAWEMKAILTLPDCSAIALWFHSVEVMPDVGEPIAEKRWWLIDLCRNPQFVRGTLVLKEAL